MATRSPEGQHGPAAADSAPADYATARAELRIYTLQDPPDVTDDPEATDDEATPDTGTPGAVSTVILPRWLITTLKRVGVTAHAQVAVPAEEAANMLAVLRRVSLTTAWTVAIAVILITTAIASLSSATIITVLAIALAGFVVCALARRPGRK